MTARTTLPLPVGIGVTELAVVFLLACAIALWLHFNHLNRLALSAARQHCQAMGVQLLDQSIVMRGLRLGRNPASGSLILIKKYSFEFATTGERRYQGITEFAGRQQLSMQLEPHSLQ